MTKQSDIKGSIFGSLVPQKYVGNKTWLCLCSCGTEVNVETKHLTKNRITSCGCDGRKPVFKKGKNHKMYRTKIHNSWRGMKARCDNENHISYHRYGGRGITYDERWRLFENFLTDMGNTYVDGFEIDRINVDGNYCKENCRWVGQAEQAYNQGLRADNKTGRVGVAFDTRAGKFRAYIRFQNKLIHLGLFDNIDDAIKVRAEAEIKYYGYTKC